WSHSAHTPSRWHGVASLRCAYGSVRVRHTAAVFQYRNRRERALRFRRFPSVSCNEWPHSQSVRAVVRVRGLRSLPHPIYIHLFSLGASLLAFRIGEGSLPPSQLATFRASTTKRRCPSSRTGHCCHTRWL